jgi:putative ABC transport system ATP-binding protein
MQRVAIARALANRPGLLLADEPTGELDRATGEQIAALLDRVNADGTALVIVTHDPALAERSTRMLSMRDGRIDQEATSHDRQARIPVADRSIRSAARARRRLWRRRRP